MGFFDKILGGGKKTPFAPDAGGLAKEQELLSRFNIETPEGRRFFSKDASGRDVLNIEESAFQQGTRGQREALASDFLSSLSGGDDRFATESKRIGDLTFERGLSRLQPLLEQSRRRTETQLATQGLPVGSEAQKAAIDELSRQETDRLTALAQTSELAAGQEQSRLRNLAGNEARFFDRELSPIDLGGFSGVANVDRAGIVQKGFDQQLNRASQEAKRQDQQRKAVLDTAGLVGSGGMSGFFGGFAPTSTGSALFRSF